jgi:2-hydroxy-6-oxonona-2,4-dienedioate hydrolase
MKDPQYIDVDGVATRYFEMGSGEPLVLVHGGHFGSFWNAEDWEHNVEGLAADFRVFALDKIGMGFSDNPATDDDYVIGTTIRHLHGFIATLGLGPAHVVGHSRGGYTVTRLAMEHPEDVTTLVIVDSSTLMTPPNPQIVEWEREAAKRFTDPRDRFRWLIEVNSYSGDHITERYLDVLEEIESLPKTAIAKARMAGGLSARFNADLVRMQGETHEWIRSGRLACPTLVVWGFDDPSATMDRNGIPAMHLILPSVARSEMHILNRAGHSCFREHPAAFNAVVTDFIRRHRGMDRPAH